MQIEKKTTMDLVIRLQDEDAIEFIRAMKRFCSAAGNREKYPIFHKVNAELKANE